MLGWFFGKAADIRQLNRDSKSILRFTREGYSADRQGKVALALRKALADAESRLDDAGEERKAVVSRLKNYHRDARRTRNDMNLTAYTLAIIYVQAEGLGEGAMQALTAIDGFLADWEHLEDEEANITF